ncbi:MAG: hypothetical protein SGI98_07095 [Verrucomicrobiota bacterium]|nr:hypothetical protein [Verrucomicrobiota bacterium]
MKDVVSTGCPTQDQGGVAMIAIQRMLMQCDAEKIHLLPAWPIEWDVEFKLHAPDQTIVEATYQSGKLLSVKVTPESRARDVVLPRDTDGKISP